jgi:Ion transport protein
LALQFQEHLRRVTDGSAFERFFLFLILANTLAMAVEYDGMPTSMSHTLSVINLVVTFIFLVEVLLKMMAVGPIAFMSNAFNNFDLFVVITSVLEISLQQTSAVHAIRSFKALRILKSFRVLRLFKVFKYLDSLRKIGEVLINSMSSFAAIAMLTLLFMLVFAIIGLHILGGSLPATEYPNFDNFFNSCVLIFQV